MVGLGEGRNNRKLIDSGDFGPILFNCSGSRYLAHKIHGSVNTERIFNVFFIALIDPKADHISSPVARGTWIISAEQIYTLSIASIG